MTKLKIELNEKQIELGTKKDRLAKEDQELEKWH
jgi:hypothetical protein